MKTKALSTNSSSEILKTRLASLDALRGFDMFWITGGSSLLISFLVLLGIDESIVGMVRLEFSHVGWEGFRLYDLIFPLFLFMSGVSMPYSIISKKEKGISRSFLHLKAFKRMLWLIGIGLSFTVFKFQPELIKLYTVLFLIGVGNYIGSLIIIYRDKPISQLFWAVGILIGYHFATYFIGYPGRIPGEVIPGNHLAGYLDQNLIPSALYMGVYDPEGTIRVISAGAMCVIGALIGTRIKSHNQASLKCAVEIFILGLITMGIGALWGTFFPIIKSIWSSSFILYTAGISMLLLSLFYLIIDVYKHRWFGFVFIPIGMNSITIYAGMRYINFKHSSEYFLGGLGKTLGENWYMFLVILGTVIIQWLFLYYLYKERIFLRV